MRLKRAYTSVPMKPSGWPTCRPEPDGIREHVEHEQLLAALGRQLGVAQRPGRVGRVERVVGVPPVLPARLDLQRERSRVPIGGCVGRDVRADGRGAVAAAHTDRQDYEFVHR